MVYLIFFYFSLVIYIPYIPVISILIHLYYSSYYYGIEFVNIVLKRRGISQREFERNNMGYILGIGLGTYITLWIPFFGYIFAPFLAVIAASRRSY